MNNKTKTTTEIINEIGDKSIQNKKAAKKLAKKKKLKKCTGNMTYSAQTNSCTPKDKSKGRLMKKVAKKLSNNKAAMKKKAKLTNATKKFRNK